MTSLKVVIAVTSPLAFSKFEGKSVIEASLSVAQNFRNQTDLQTTIAIATSDPLLVSGFDCEVLICEPNSPQSLAQALARAGECENLCIHDALRPMTTTAQFHRTLTALVEGVDAVRPVAAFTESLKIVNTNEFIIRSIDRTSMMRVSTPELIRFSAIDFTAQGSTWFVPLKANSKFVHVDSDSQSLRANSAMEILLMESFSLS